MKKVAIVVLSMIIVGSLLLGCMIHPVEGMTTKGTDNKGTGTKGTDNKGTDNKGKVETTPPPPTDHLDKRPIPSPMPPSTSINSCAILQTTINLLNSSSTPATQNSVQATVSDLTLMRKQLKCT